MKLSLTDIAEEDRGLLSPCGIICGGCDVYTNESVEAAKTIVQIWEGFNLADVAMAAGLISQEVLTIINNLRKFIKHREETNTCPGCYTSGGPFKRCPIWKCVKSKGYWTCAECEECNVESESPCPHPETNYPDIPLSSKGEMLHLVCKRYKSNNIENLKKCREIGYPAFVEEAKEKLGKGWRTWQVISNEMVVTKSLASQ
jgi:hypothetical protein